MCYSVWLSNCITRDECTDIGTKAFVSLYGGNPKTDTLNQHNLYLKKIIAEFNTAKLPPTEDAAVDHLQRLHLLNMIRCICKTETNESCGSGRCNAQRYVVTAWVKSAVIVHYMK